MSDTDSLLDHLPLIAPLIPNGDNVVGYWIDGELTCLDHAEPIYTRVEAEPIFNWEPAAQDGCCSLCNEPLTA